MRVGSGRMGQGKRSPPQNEHGGGDERSEGERPHYHGRGRGQRHARGRGRGQGRGYFNNKEVLMCSHPALCLLLVCSQN